VAEAGRAVSRGRGAGPRTAAAAARGAGAPAAGRWRPGPRALALAQVLLVVGAAALAIYRTRERDFWFHLAAGRSILQHGLPATERWCLAARGQWPWLGEWLYHVALYATRALGGDVAVALWRAAWFALAVGLALAVARVAGAVDGGTPAPRPRAVAWTAALLAPLALAIARERQAARPEQVTVALVLLALLLFERARRGGRDRTAWLIPVTVLWANLHPGWVLAPLIAVIEAACAALDRAARPRAARWALLALALFAAGALTPRPLDTLGLRLVRDVGADPMLATIEELRPWSWPDDRAAPFTALLALAAIAAALGGARAWRRSPALVLAALGGLAAGLAAYRYRALGALLALPALATALAPAAGRARRLGVPLAAAAALAGAAWLGADAPRFPWGAAPLLDAVPVRAVALADSLALPGPVLDSPWFGGYILWARGDGQPPLQDARGLGSAAFRSRMVRARLDPAALDTLDHEWRFTHAVLEPPTDTLDDLARRLFHRPGWALVASDDAGLLFVRRDLRPEWTAARAYRVLSPDYRELAATAMAAQHDTALARALEAELRRAAAESPWNARAHLWLGLLALARGQAREALGHFDRVERLAPVTPGLALRQGMAREQIGDQAGAARAYRRALALPTDAVAARVALRALEGR
jgi:hypothetical protein